MSKNYTGNIKTKKMEEEEEEKEKKKKRANRGTKLRGFDKITAELFKNGGEELQKKSFLEWY